MDLNGDRVRDQLRATLAQIARLKSALRAVESAHDRLRLMLALLGRMDSLKARGLLIQTGPRTFRFKNDAQLTKGPMK